MILSSCKSYCVENKEFPIYPKEQLLVMFEEGQKVQQELLENIDVRKIR